LSAARVYSSRPFTAAIIFIQRDGLYMRLCNLLLAQALLFSTGCALSASGAQAAENGAVVERKSYGFPSYERAVESTDVEDYADKAEYESAAGDTKFELEKLKYLSDGLKVVAYVYRPRQTGDRKFPAVINLAQRLQKLGRVYELVVYAGDNHILSNNKEDRDRRALGWFKRHMKKQ
jgi:hypothetical protein